MFNVIKELEEYKLILKEKIYELENTEEEDVFKYYKKLDKLDKQMKYLKNWYKKGIKNVLK